MGVFTVHDYRCALSQTAVPQNIASLLHHYCIIIISLFVRHHWIILCKKCKLFLNIFSVKYSNITVTSNTLNSIKIIQMYVVIHLVT